MGYDGAMVDPAWVLAMMVALEPTSPFRPTFEETAAAIADAASADPLPLGDRRAEKTAAVLVSVAWFESRFQQDAAGDCDQRKPDGTCAPGARPRSFCAFQIEESNHKALGVTREELQSSIETCTRAALRMMRMSFRACAARPLDERLDWYAAGGPSCTAPRHQEGVHRMRKGRWLYQRHAPHDALP